MDLPRTALAGEDNPYRPLMIRVVTWVGVAACLLFVGVNVARDIPAMIVADAAAAIVLVVNLLLYRRHGNATIVTVGGLGPVVVICVLGADMVGPQVLALLGPTCLVAFFLLGKRGGALFAAATLLLVLAWMILFDPLFIDDRPPVDILVGVALIGVVGYVYESVRTTYARDLQRLSATDPLTGALNRRSCERILEEELVRSERYGRPLSVLLFDIDHFKRINDEHGHAAGDAVLRDLADRVRAVVRQNDALVRWGGEEFLVVMPETVAEGARVAAERIRRVVERDPLGPGVPTTLSGGVATARAGDDQDSLVHRADELLYRAKNTGRNRICCGDEPPEREDRTEPPESASASVAPA